MFTGLTTSSGAIAKLFDAPYLFAVPSYQRCYSWSLREAGQLLEDVAAAAGVDGGGSYEPDYFLGTILLLETQGDATAEGLRGRVFEIVDGQQRIATLTILLCVLRDLGVADVDRHVTNGAEEQRQGWSFRLDLRSGDQVFFERYVLTPGATAIGVASDNATPSESAILEVRNMFRREISDLDQDSRNQLARYVAECCHVVVVKAHDIDRAHRLFSVLNERGKPLRRNDILKAEVLHGLSDPQSARALELWDRAENRLGKNFEDLFSHIRTIHGKSRPQVIAAIRDIIIEAGGAAGFIENVFKPYSEAFIRIVNADKPDANLDPVIRRHLLYLRRLPGSDWVPSAMAALKLYDREPELARMAMGEIDRLAHVLRLLGMGTGKRMRRFEQVSGALRRGQWLLPDVGPFELSRDEVRTVLYNLKSIHKRNQGICRLILLRLNDQMTGKFLDVEPTDWSVEHVLPSRPSASSQWRQWFADHNERESCTDSVGNLVLVTHLQNEKARNEEFARKQAIYRTPEQGAPILEITRAAIEASTWLMADIKAREAHLMSMLTTMWRVGTRTPAMPERDAGE